MFLVDAPEIVKTYAAFTNHAFLLDETVAVAALLKEDFAPDEVKRLILEQDLFSLRANASRRTLASAILTRLKGVPEVFLDNLSGDRTLQMYTTFYLILLRHRLLREFIEEVLLEHVQRLVRNVTETEITAFFERKRQLEPVVAKWSEATLNKSRVNLIKILVEATVLAKTSGGFDIVPNLIPEKLKHDLRTVGHKSFIILMLGADL